MATVGIADIGAEGGNFHLEGIVADEDDAELRADIEGRGGKSFRTSCGVAFVATSKSVGLRR